MPKIFKTPNGKTKPKSICEQISLGRQSRLKVQNALAHQAFSENPGLKFPPNAAVPISNMLEEISQNLSKMDQNLYSTKANMEEIIRSNNNNNEFVSLN